MEYRFRDYDVETVGCRLRLHAGRLGGAGITPPLRDPARAQRAAQRWLERWAARVSVVIGPVAVCVTNVGPRAPLLIATALAVRDPLPGHRDVLRVLLDPAVLTRRQPIRLLVDPPRVTPAA